MLNIKNRASSIAGLPKKHLFVEILPFFAEKDCPKNKMYVYTCG